MPNGVGDGLVVVVLVAVFLFHELATWVPAVPVRLAPVYGITLILYQALDPAGAAVVVELTVPDPLLRVRRVLVPAV